MKRLDLVTVLFNRTPLSPGIVLDLTETEGRKPSLRLALAIDSGAALEAVSIPNVPHLGDDPNGSHTWREYSPDDFGTTTPNQEPAGEPQAVPQGDAGGQAE